MRFRFRLETLLRVARAERDAARREAFDAARRLEEAEGAAACLEDAQRLNGERRDGALRGGIPARELRLRETYGDGLRPAIEAARGRAGAAARDRYERLEELVARNRRARTLEELRQRRFRRYLLELGRKEQKALDELHLLGRLHGERSS